MEDKKFQNPELTIIEFCKEDIIVTSNGDEEGFENGPDY